MIRGQVLLLEDMNTHSLIWNSHYQRKKYTKPLKDLLTNLAYSLTMNLDEQQDQLVKRYRILI